MPPPSVPCPGCRARLPAPPEYAGRTVRCGRCGLEFPLPDQPLDSIPVLTSYLPPDPADSAPPPPPPPPPAPRVVVRPVAAQPPVEKLPPPPPPVPPADDPDDREADRPARRRARPADDEPEDDRPTRRRSARRQRVRPAGGGMAPQQRAALTVGGIALAGLLVIGCCGGGVYWFTSGSGDAGGGLFDSWSRHTVPGTDLSVELPKPPKTSANMQLGNAAGQGSLGALTCESGGLTFLASVSSLAPPAGGPQFPGGAGMGEMMVGMAGIGPDSRVVNRDPVQGRKAVLFVQRNDKGSAVNLMIADGPRTYSLMVAGQSVDENHPAAKRFVESVRFEGGPAANPPAPAPAFPSLPSLPNFPSFGGGDWERRTVPGTTISVEMPKPGPKAPQGSPYDGTGAQGLYSEPDEKTKFLAGPMLGLRPGARVTVEELVRGATDPSLGGRLVRQFTLQGRSAAIVVGRDGVGGDLDSANLYLQNGRGVIVLTVTRAGVTENDPDVKRFFDSIRPQ